MDFLKQKTKANFLPDAAKFEREKTFITTNEVCQVMTDRLKTGSEKFDAFLEGGYEKGVITTIYGPSGTGKTTACLLALTSASKEGKVFFIDTEGGFSTERLKQITPDYENVLERTIIKKPLTFEEQGTFLKIITENLPKETSMVICDTVTALYRLNRTEDNQNANQELTRQIGRLLETARKNDVPILMTNQVYSDFEGKNSVRMAGGDIVLYNSKCLIEFQNADLNKRIAFLKKHRSLPSKTEKFEIINRGFI